MIESFPSNLRTFWRSLNLLSITIIIIIIIIIIIMIISTSFILIKPNTGITIIYATLSHIYIMIGSCPYAFLFAVATVFQLINTRSVSLSA